MQNFIYSLFGWTYGQINTFENFLETVKKLISFQIPFKRIGITLLAVVELFFSACFKTPITPRGEELDLTGYNLVFKDDFDGTELNTDAWFHRSVGARRAGFNAESQATVNNGNLIITGEYLENGQYGKGWYAGAVSLKESYTRGYFEIRCKCNKDKGFWSAFWLQAMGNPYDHTLSNGGIDAVEIDIFEAMSAGEMSNSMRNTVISTIHCNGVDENPDKLDSQSVGKFYVGNDIYSEYNTYGLKWTEDEYIFYINGVESGRSHFGKGVCINPEQVIISLEIPENFPESITSNTNYKTQMIIDYVKIYQIAE